MALDTPPTAGNTYLLTAADWEPGIGLQPPWDQFRHLVSSTVLINGGVAAAVREPQDEDVRTADQAYSGGSDHLVNYDTALIIYNAGYGRWLTQV